MNKQTQQEKIVRLMAAHREKEWWYPPDFMRPELGDLFVGYEASARLSELQRDFPAVFETRNALPPFPRKYKQRRIRWEDAAQWSFIAPEWLRSIARSSLPPAFEVGKIRGVDKEGNPQTRLI